jgi:hypothetical protein
MEDSASELEAARREEAAALAALPDDYATDDTIRRLVSEGRALEAIIRLRRVRGQSLAEAFAFVSRSKEQPGGPSRLQSAGPATAVAEPGFSGDVERTLLKPRLANNIVMILGGCFISAFGFGPWALVNGYGRLILGIFGLLGVLWIVVASLTLAQRGQMAIIIERSGIEVPAIAAFQRGLRRVFIRRQDITAISKHESLKGRLIAIDTTGGGKLLVQVRQYCKLDEFLSHCKRYGLPVSET